MELKIKKINEKAVLPSFAHAEDAGMDLCTTEDFTLEPGERFSVPTGIAMSIPVGYVGLIWDKSGVAQKRGIKTLGGVVDSGYTGEIFVGVVNLGNDPQTFEVGNKVAQILIQKVEHPEILLVESLEETSRGEKAFGSTGI